ncbi:armadillo-type protein [Cercophora scortea]|uniref:Armadillo-type protein n=1 Tax=Cercophora scortea TaxID=314031 RepID=A0AAE0IB97_9PEZI|nr:armadillo-type protein [Cercophora scortea]
MARIQSPPILSRMRGARSYADQVAALRALKDEIVGHVQNKDKWVELNILESLIKILQSSYSSSRLGGKEVRGQFGQPRSLADEEEVRLQALQLLASLANGGPSFLGPIHAVGAIPAILSNIFPLEHPPQLVLTALRALSNIADAASLALNSDDALRSLADNLFVSRYLDALYTILSSDSTAVLVQEQKSLVASLVIRLCREGHHQNALANAGVLDALATMLAEFVVLRGEVVPGAEIIGEADGLADMIPNPAPRGANLALVLEAISTIIADSRFRACMLLCSPAIMAIFPSTEFSPPAKDTRTAWNALEMSGLSNLRAKNPSAVDYLLPIVPVTQPRSLSSQLAQFPPLGFSLSRESLAPTGQTGATRFSGWTSTRLDSASLNGDAEADDPESPLIPWLIHLVRSTSGLERAMAASVVASLFKAGFANPEREVALGVLVVPPLCQLIKDHDNYVDPATQNSAFVEPSMAADWAILERTPAVLARLVADSEFLQQAAFESGALKMVCKLLKDSYEPMSTQPAPRPWSPNPDRGADRGDNRVGPPGRLPIYAHKIKTRESALKLIAAMVTFKDEYRKALVEQEIVPYIVESLSPVPSKPKMGKEKPKPERATEPVEPAVENPAYGSNPNSVIIAACHVMRILGRSVSNLRTALEDHGVAMPVFKLLAHPDVEVQIAACGAVCNLVTEFSPMREALVDAGIVKILCEHAHSLNPGLRLNSMWALKHLVHAVDNNLKKQCLEELESGWLVQLICDDTEDEALHARVRMERRMSDVDDDDEDMDALAYEDGTRVWLWPAMYLPAPSLFASRRSQSQRMLKAEKKLVTLREAEFNPTRKARNDDLAIQEQGLNFIRNLIGPPTPSSMTEMVDYVFNELGQDRLFEILASKLRVKVLHPFARRYSSGRDSRVLHPQAKVIEAVIYILVHMAASIPRHRQLVIAQTELLKLLGGYFSSKDIDVRRALCHLLNNLVWLDDSTDNLACQQRAQELRKLGFLAKLEGLQQADSDLDIRERAKAAVWQLKVNH